MDRYTDRPKKCLIALSALLFFLFEALLTKEIEILSAVLRHQC
jgi:hypothetical protein